MDRIRLAMQATSRDREAQRKMEGPKSSLLIRLRENPLPRSSMKSSSSRVNLVIVGGELCDKASAASCSASGFHTVMNHASTNAQHLGVINRDNVFSGIFEAVCAANTITPSLGLMVAFIVFAVILPRVVDGPPCSLELMHALVRSESWARMQETRHLGPCFWLHPLKFLCYHWASPIGAGERI
ncbi:hypothetical protein VNO77_03042 [Canavalia gladiata]|uniref:Uncharacterized protein n=1 Tax=Canavalia gladiata TaxID=3824 RepID=A0AAN9MZ11_CANGL